MAEPLELVMEDEAPDRPTISSEVLNIVIINGSTREGGVGTRITAWLAGEIDAVGGFAIETIDLAGIDLPALYSSHEDPAVQWLRRQLEWAAAFVVVTPEYNHGYPALLKHAIDHAYIQWRAKPVAFVSHGGMSGGLRAVEQLRQVFAELHAVTIRDTVSFHRAEEQFDAGGRPIDEVGPSRAAQVMLRQLAWWARALRHARRTWPYIG